MIQYQIQMVHHMDLRERAMLRGILPVLPTPFRSDGAVDPEALLRVAEFAVGTGAAGLVFPGFASEVDDLSPGERGLLLGRLAGFAGGRLPIVAGASSPSVEEAVARCREAAELGVTTVMIQAPKSVGATATDVSAFYAAIARQTPGIDIVLQNAPAPRGSDLSPDTILAIAADNPAIRYVKEETLPSGPAITRLVAERPATVLGVLGGGGARYIIEEYRRGAGGAMPAAEFTDLHVQLDAHWRAGREAEARRLYELLLPLLVMQAFSRMRFTKHVLTRRGILSNDVVRARIPPLDAHERAEIDALLERLDDRLSPATRRQAA
jgi:4-hydroxy-tetrahydrodipicolinate synthase